MSIERAEPDAPRHRALAVRAMNGISPAIAVFGAGSIGCYIGGRLAAAGAPVLLVGRKRIADAVAAHGLRLSDYKGAEFHVPGARAEISTDPAILAGARLILVTVKAQATRDAGAILAEHAQPDAVVVSFQNGIGNADLLRAQLPGRTVLAGMVPFNVVHRDAATFHQSTQGALDVAASAALAPFLAAFARAGLPLTQHADIRSVQWAKLLLNLNNPINALSGLPLREELSRRPFRRCLAMAQEEALSAMRLAGIRPARLTPLPPAWIPAILRLPDALFRLLAGRMLKIDPTARSSTQDDLDAGRPTEVDWLNGEIVRLAASVGGAAAANAALVRLVHEAERGGRRDWDGDDLLRELHREIG